MMHPKAASLSIKRVPKETVDTFKKYAEEEFVGDYGMALKKLVDVGLIEGNAFDKVQGVLEDHEQRLAKLENTDEKDVTVAKTLSGREIKKSQKE